MPPVAICQERGLYHAENNIHSKIEISGGFFLDHDHARKYLTNAVTLSNNRLLFVDNSSDECEIRKIDCTRYHYDIVSA